MPIDSIQTTAGGKSSQNFYYEALEDPKTTPVIYLTDEEEKDRRHDYQEVFGMRQHHAEQHPAWNKAGNFYNIVQSGEGADSISRYAVGLSRTIIDAGISMMNEGDPEASFKPIGPSDRKISVLWDALVKHQLSKSNWRAHQKLWTTDLHIFGSSPLEAFVNPVVRRKNEEPGLFLIRMATQARTGLRHRSIWTSFRNPNVIDPDEVPSCAWEETVTHGQWVSRYANRPDFKNVDQIPVYSKYKLTHITNEIENTYRIYCMPFGRMAEAYKELTAPVYELGYPVYSERLTKLNPLGMCPMSFGIFSDQLTADYKQHSLYGMGIPQLIEGMEMIMEGLFNMTVDNMRLKNTVPVGYQPYQGQTDYPDLDNFTIETGRVYPGKFEPMSLGIADMQSNTQLWEWVNNLCIWITGYNFQQIGGDTSKTAYEFAQRLKANNNRAASRLQALENGPLKRSFNLLLANSLSQVTKDEWEDITETQAKDIAAMITNGTEGVDSYKFENGKIIAKKFTEYFPLPDYKVSEDFTKSKKRKLDTSTVDNTLTMYQAKGETGMVPAVPQYLFPNGEVAQMLAFTVEVDSKQMLGDLQVHDSEAIDKWLNQAVTMMPMVPQITPQLMFDLLKQSGEKAGLDIEAAMDDKQDSPILKKVKSIVGQMQALHSQPPMMQKPPMPALPGQPSAPGSNPMQAPTGQLPGLPQAM